MPTPDRFDLYELFVTNPVPMARFFQGVHAGLPRVLREDFCGTAALARGWLSIDRSHRAIGVDSDARALARAGRSSRLGKRCADVLAARDRADIIAATNFPLGYFHSRGGLLAYLRHVRRCLRPGGIFACDLYGGPGSLRPSRTSTSRALGDGTRVRYTWEQRRIEPTTMRVLNAMHFLVRPARGRAREIRDAFVYDWRLWSIPELAEALEEAGLGDLGVYDRLGDAIDAHGRVWSRPLEQGELSGEDWVVYVVARTPKGARKRSESVRKAWVGR